MLRPGCVVGCRPVRHPALFTDGGIFFGRHLRWNTPSLSAKLAWHGKAEGPVAKTTLIRNTGWVVAWDTQAGRHVYQQGADVAFSGNAITHVGQGYPGSADEVIDGRDLMVMPGLIDIHSHPSTEPFYRGIREEHGVPAMFMSGLYERSLA